MAVFGMTKKYLVLIVPLGFAYLGKLLDDMETERLSMFRDKSSLYGRVMAPGEKPSWP